jgi:hypothetical protein
VTRWLCSAEESEGGVASLTRSDTFMPCHVNVGKNSHKRRTVDRPDILYFTYAIKLTIGAKLVSGLWCHCQIASDLIAQSRHFTFKRMLKCFYSGESVEPLRVELVELLAAATG